MSANVQVERACSLWRGFLISREKSPDLALVFCKGALISLNKESGGSGT